VRGRIDVCDQNGRAGVSQSVGERGADAAGALDEHGSPCELVRSEGPFEAGADPVEDPDGRRSGRIPGSPCLDGPAEDELGSLPDDIHVRFTCIEVGARTERSAQRADQVAVP
jgi:hypothetical protein